MSTTLNCPAMCPAHTHREVSAEDLSCDEAIGTVSAKKHKACRGRCGSVLRAVQHGITQERCTNVVVRTFGDFSAHGRGPGSAPSDIRLCASLAGLAVFHSRRQCHPLA